jgi:hypothetical protein
MVACSQHTAMMENRKISQLPLYIAASTMFRRCTPCLAARKAPLVAIGLSALTTGSS